MLKTLLGVYFTKKIVFLNTTPCFFFLKKIFVFSPTCDKRKEYKVLFDRLYALKTLFHISFFLTSTL